MMHLDYHFSAFYFSTRRVTLSVTPYGIPMMASLDDTEAIWQNILNCFWQSRFYAVARIIETLPYKRGAYGAFDIGGSLRDRKEVFYLLSPERSCPPKGKIAATVRFFRSFNEPDLQVEHWTGRLWYAAPEQDFPLSAQWLEEGV